MVKIYDEEEKEVEEEIEEESKESTEESIEAETEEAESTEAEAEIEREVPEEACYVMFPKGKDVKYLFTALANLLHEANLLFSPDGIKMKSIDPSKVSLLILDIPSINLEEVHVPSETKVGVVFDILKKVVKRIKARDKIEFMIKPGAGRFYLTIYSKKGKEAGIYRRFGLPIVAVAEEEIPEPNIVYPARVRMDIDTFTDIVAAADEISDAVTFIIKPDSFIIRATGEGGKALEAEYTRTDEAIYEIETEETCEGTFSTEYILDCTRQMRQICEYIIIELATNKPLKLTYEFSVGKLQFYLAPRAV
ncbi:MAG: DNA polymerase sliding clamp [Crenarchaeota archaeon]|nr:DNA polymerase sliding clamp [Thermoproteota archaeon]